MTYQIPLTVNYDSIREVFVVREASNGFSQSKCPNVISKGEFKKLVHFEFDTKAEAYEQVRRLNKWRDNGGKIEFLNYFTDGLFETVADTKYGCAWN